MKTNEFQPVSFDDVIFENRHRGYGAYDIRKHYDAHLKTASTLALCFILLLILSPRIMQHFSTPVVITQPVIPEEDLPYIELSDIKLPKPEVPAPPTPPASLETIDLRVPVVVNRIVNPTPIHTNDELLNSNAIIGSRDNDGVLNSNTFTGGESGTSGTGTSNIIPAEPELPLLFVEDMPTFAGGDAALHKFIAEHIRYPQNGINYNLQGTVWIQFTVGKNGKVTDPKIIKSIKGGFDEEAIRVVKMMPAWNPGKQNGREVPVYIKLPIKFTLNN